MCYFVQVERQRTANYGVLLNTLRSNLQIVNVNANFSRKKLGVHAYCGCHKRVFKKRTFLNIIVGVETRVASTDTIFDGKKGVTNDTNPDSTGCVLFIRNFLFCALQGANPAGNRQDLQFNFLAWGGLRTSRMKNLIMFRAIWKGS